MANNNLSSKGPDGTYIKYTLTNYNNSNRDDKGYIITPAKCLIYKSESDYESGLEPRLIIENRVPVILSQTDKNIPVLSQGQTLELPPAISPWLNINNKIYLVMNANQSCVKKYHSNDLNKCIDKEKYKSVLIDCQSFTPIYLDINRWNLSVGLGMFQFYDGYTNNISVTDLVNMKQIEFESFPSMTFKSHQNNENKDTSENIYIYLLKDGGIAITPDNTYVSFYSLFKKKPREKDITKEEEKGIVILLTHNYRLLNDMAFIDEEATFSGDPDADKYNPLAIYTNEDIASNTQENYAFKICQVGYLIFIIKDGKLKLNKQSYITPKTMLITEFESLYRYEGEYSAWLRNDDMQISRYFKIVELII